MEGLHRQSSRCVSCNRPVRCANDWLQAHVCHRHYASQTPGVGLDERHTPPNRGMDCTATHRGLSMGTGPESSHPRSRRQLWCRVQAPLKQFRYPRTSDRASLALAKRLCGTDHRLNPPRVPGSRHHFRRDTLAPDAEVLCPILQSGANAPVACQRFTRSSTSSAPRRHYHPHLSGLHHEYSRTG